MCKTFILYKKSNFSTSIKHSTITPCNNYTETVTAVALKPWKIEYTIIWIQYYVIQQTIISFLNYMPLYRDIFYEIQNASKNILESKNNSEK